MTARARILELPEATHSLGTRDIPVGAIDALLQIQAVSAKLAALVADVIADASAQGDALGEQLARDPGWLVRQALTRRPSELFAALVGGALYEDQIAELKLGKKTTVLHAEAKTLHGQLDRTQVILDRGVHRELVKTAVTRTVEELRARAQERASERKSVSGTKRERTPREFTRRAHLVNLDLGAALLDGLAAVDPGTGQPLGRRWFGGC